MTTDNNTPKRSLTVKRSSTPSEGIQMFAKFVTEQDQRIDPTQWTKIAGARVGEYIVVWVRYVLPPTTETINAYVNEKILLFKGINIEEFYNMTRMDYTFDPHTTLFAVFKPTKHAYNMAISFMHLVQDRIVDTSLFIKQ